MSAQILTYKPRRLETTRRMRITVTLTNAAMNCTSDHMTEVWLRKARQATYLPSSELTARPQKPAVDLPVDEFEPAARPVSLMPWIICGLAVCLAIAMTPMGWLP